jgi:DNA-binding FrmR family transcriptional regulator
MVERDEYCVDIIRQVLAVQSALDRVNSLILSNHLETCVTTAIRAEDPEARTRVLAELTEVFDLANKL